MCAVQLIVGVHRPFYCDSSDYTSNDNGDQTFAARQRAALEQVFNAYKVRRSLVIRSTLVPRPQQDLQAEPARACVPALCAGTLSPMRFWHGQRPMHESSVHARDCTGGCFQELTLFRMQAQTGELD